MDLGSSGHADLQSISSHTLNSVRQPKQIKWEWRRILGRGPSRKHRESLSQPGHQLHWQNLRCSLTLELWSLLEPCHSQGGRDGKLETSSALSTAAATHPLPPATAGASAILLQPVVTACRSEGGRKRLPPAYWGSVLCCI